MTRAAAAILAEAAGFIRAEGFCDMANEQRFFDCHTGRRHDADRFRTMRFNRIFEARWLPLRWLRPSPTSVNLPFFLNERLAQSVRSLDEPGAEASFQAKLAPAHGRSLGRGRPQETVGNHVQIQIASDRTEGADRGHLVRFPRTLTAVLSSGFEGAGRATFDASAAGDAGAFRHRFSHGRPYRSRKASADKPKHGKSDDILTGPDAASAKDALVRVECDQRMAAVDTMPADFAGKSAQYRLRIRRHSV